MKVGNNTFRAVQPYLKDLKSYCAKIGYKEINDIHVNWIKTFILKPYLLNKVGDKKVEEGKKQLMLLAHRSSYKSTCVACGVSFLLLVDPKFTCMIGHASEEHAKAKVRNIANIVKTKFFKDLYKKIHKKDVWLQNDNMTNMKLNTSPPTIMFNVAATGLRTSKMTGMHVDMFIGDDIANLEDYERESKRRDTLAFYTESHNVLNPNGVYFLVGTCWHDEDIYSTIERKTEKGAIDCYILKYPIFSIQIKHITPTWAEQQKEIIGLRTYYSQYELKHLVPEESPFFNIDDKFISLQSLLDQQKDNPHQSQAFFHIDKSFEGDDKTALTKIILVNHKHYLVSGWAWDGSIRKCLPFIKPIIQSTPNYYGIFMETNDDKGSFASENQESKMLDKLKTYAERMNKIEKIDRFAISLWENNRLFFNEQDMKHNNAFLQPCALYTRQIREWNRRRGKRQQDDAIDSMSSCLRAIQSTLKTDQLQRFKSSFENFLNDENMI